MRTAKLSPIASWLLFLSFFSIISTGTAGATTERILHNFIFGPMGVNPAGPLVADAAGNLYGANEFGGEHGYGSVFKLALKSNGKWATTVIYSFSGGTADGEVPLGGPSFDSAGNLYGVTDGGGASECGTIYQLLPGRGGEWKEHILHAFTGKNGDGCQPAGTLSFDADGNIYGTTMFGGMNNSGMVFELTPSSGGWVEISLYEFLTGGGTSAGVIPDESGNLYGSIAGIVFRLARRGNGTWAAHGICSCGSVSGLMFDADGNLFGASNSGGYGTVFELKRMPHGWRRITLYTFLGGADGAYPWYSLVSDSTGNLYGVTLLGGIQGVCSNGQGCGTVFQLTPRSDEHWTHKVVYAFRNPSDGEAPDGLFMGAAGTLYGTTYRGGDQYCIVQDIPGCGNVFMLSPKPRGHWKHRTLVSFPVGDGQEPTSSLIRDSFGNLYGTVPSGGPYNGGIAFKLTRESAGTWRESILHNFGGPNDGSNPSSSLVFDDSGNLYGTATYGGTGGYGAVFKLAPNSDGTWNETVLYSFGGPPGDGSDPMAGLIIDGNGDLYDTTSYGGSNECQYYSGNLIGCGTVFALSPLGQGSWAETILHVFTGYPNDGYLPSTALLLDPMGNLYGTTLYGGHDDNCADNEGDTLGCGSIFELSPASGGKWTESGFYSFPTGKSRWGVNASSLVLDQGHFYGTTATDGAYGGGTFYQLRSAGGKLAPNPLYNFGGYAGDGTGPNSVVFDNAGNAYGSTLGGGNSTACNNCGTVFKLTPGSAGWSEQVLYNFAGPFGDGMLPMSGVVLDSAGNIYGTTSQGGVDSVLFRGAPYGGAVFEVRSGH